MSVCVRSLSSREAVVQLHELVMEVVIVLAWSVVLCLPWGEVVVQVLSCIPVIIIFCSYVLLNEVNSSYSIAFLSIIFFVSIGYLPVDWKS